MTYWRQVWKQEEPPEKNDGFSYGYRKLQERIYRRSEVDSRREGKSIPEQLPVRMPPNFRPQKGGRRSGKSFPLAFADDFAVSAYKSSEDMQKEGQLARLSAYKRPKVYADTQISRDRMSRINQNP